MLWIFILSILLGALLYLSMMSIYKIFRVVPGNRSMRNLIGIREIGRSERDLTDRILEMSEKTFLKVITGHLRFSQERKAQIERDLARVSSNDSYERYLLKMVIYPTAAFVGLFIVSVFIGLLGSEMRVPSYLFKGIAVFAAFGFFSEPRLELKRKLAEKETKIILEMPRFIRTIRYSPNSKGLYRIIEDYLKTAKEGLHYDLTVLKADMDMTGEEKALHHFSERVNIPEIREFVTVLITSIKGDRKEADMNLYFVENKFLDRADRISDEEMKKRPEILDTINELLLQGLGVLFIIPILLYCLMGIKTMMAK